MEEQGLRCSKLTKLQGNSQMTASFDLTFHDLCFSKGKGKKRQKHLSPIFKKLSPLLATKISIDLCVFFVGICLRALNQLFRSAMCTAYALEKFT